MAAAGDKEKGGGDTTGGIVGPLVLPLVRDQVDGLEGIA